MQKFNNTIYIGTLTNDKKKFYGDKKNIIKKKNPTSIFTIKNLSLFINDRFLIVKILLLCYGWFDLQCNIL